MKAKEIKKLEGLDEEEFMKFIEDNLNKTSIKILQAINPVVNDDIPYIIASMETLLAGLKKNHPKAAALAISINDAFETEFCEEKNNKAKKEKRKNGKKNQ